MQQEQHQELLAEDTQRLAPLLACVGHGQKCGLQAMD
jgi:hypothetical protein